MFMRRCFIVPAAAIDMFDHGVYKGLIPLLSNPSPGVKGAAAQAARNIFVLEVKYRRAFRDSGGCGPLVNMLDMPPDTIVDPKDLELQLEAVCHIDDFIIFNG